MNNYETYKSLLPHFSELKDRIDEIVKERQLSPLLNDVKWIKLYEQMGELEIPPAYDYQLLIDDTPLVIMDKVPTSGGGWDNFTLDEWFTPFYAIEKMVIYGKLGTYVGRLVDPTIFDQTEVIRRMLQEINIPFEEVPPRVFEIMGYR